MSAKPVWDSTLSLEMPITAGEPGEISPTGGGDRLLLYCGVGTKKQGTPEAPALVKAL